MNRTIILSSGEVRRQKQAGRLLAETQRILRELAAERRRTARSRAVHTSLVAEVKAILQGS